MRWTSHFPPELPLELLHQILDGVYEHTAIEIREGETAEVVSWADSGSSVLVGPTSSSWGKRVGDDAARERCQPIKSHQTAHQLQGPSALDRAQHGQVQ